MGVDVRQLSPSAQKQVLQKLLESNKRATGASLSGCEGKDASKKKAAQNGSKYGNKKVEVNGILFDSKREARRWLELDAMAKAGMIHDLQRQVEFELIPAQYEAIERYGKKGQRLKDGQRLIEKKCVYVADFTYWKGDQRVVEDTKGHRTEKYIIKRKLMLYVHGIRIREV